MKKIYLFAVILMAFMSISCNAENLTLNNNYISLNFNVNNKSVTLNQITNVKNHSDYIIGDNFDYSIWSFTCKKSKDYAGEEIKLEPKDAEKFSYKQNENIITFVWNNVKTKDMPNGFDVTVNVNLKDNNSYWNINISENSDYGPWHVEFPKISNLDFENNLLMQPIQGGGLFEKLDADEIKYDYPNLGCPMQIFGLTDKKTSLYLSTEDLNGNFKSFKLKQNNKKLDFSVLSYPENMALCGKEFKLDYNFNISVLKGDHYDICKKYRKWGIDNKFTPFSKGKIENRKDLPQWWKDNCVSIVYDAPGPAFAKDNVGETVLYENTKNAIKFLNVPILVHLYWWSEHEFDSNYPNMLPALSYIKAKINDLRTIPGVKIMPYTNGELTDIKNSAYYKKYGDEMVAKTPEGKYYATQWGNKEKAENVVSCITGRYSDCYKEEILNILKEMDFDAHYYDQVCAEEPRPCFNLDHNHPYGGGHIWVDAYKKLMNENREILNKYKGEPIPITSESSAEPYPVDAWLRCNEVFPPFADEPLTSYIYSGYVTSFGDKFYEDEFTTEDSLPVINKTAVTLCKGIQPGWHLSNWTVLNLNNKKSELEAYPKFGNYFKDVVNARIAAKEYFNLGEMVRKVNIVSPVPQKNIYWHMWANEYHLDFPLVRTCSFNYKGKTMICFTSISDDPIEISWKSKAGDLMLKDKKSYKLSEVYPNKKSKKVKALSDTFTIKPLSTMIFVVE